jgi:TatD DNase family protein
MIVDSHAHLDMPRYDPDREDVICRARDAGLHLVVTIGTASPEHDSVSKTLRLIEKHDFLYAGLGVHPHDARLVDEIFLEDLEHQTRHPKVILWGEIGLDYYYDNSPRDVQIEVFRWQLSAARRCGLPISVHCRDAWPDLVRILREEWTDGTPGGILHSFSGDRAQALEGAALGFLISFSGMVTFKNGFAIRDAASVLNLDQVLVETDSPYLAPVPHRGKRNEPAFVVDVARGLAEAMNVSYEEMALRTSRNMSRFTVPSSSTP